MFTEKSDIGAYVMVKGLGNVVAVTAGTTYDAAVQTSTVFDHTGYQSAVVGINYTATLTSSKTFNMGLVTVYSGLTSTDVTTVLATGLVSRTMTAAVTGESNALCFDVDLAGAKQFVKFECTPDLTAAGTDTAVFGLFAVLGGASNLPTSKSIT